MGQSRPLLAYFHSFHTANIAQKLYMIKALMVCLGLEPGAGEWSAQTNPLVAPLREVSYLEHFFETNMTPDMQSRNFHNMNSTVWVF